jgi:hypothetical protein
MRALAIAISVAVLVAGCGGGSSKSGSSRTTTSTTAAGQTVVSRDKTFATVTPHGFKDATNSAQGSALRVQYLAIGPISHGFATNINVVREPSRGLIDADTIATFELTAIKRIERKAHSFSQLQPVTVGGLPARSVDYLNTPGGSRELHQRQVFVRHGNAIYTVTYTALPGSYAASAGAMDEVLKNWSWR